ncbi:MAG TPA: RnfABCDGE type electron transport complex subunit G [Desulfonatronum sp.]|nr:RnfABCDGE type electron transport complex subunit G [Desulfonatronum sp.]
MSLREIIQMVLVLTIVAAVCAGGLAAVKMVTMEQIEYQQIKFIKEPALKKILTDYDNDPISDRIQLVTGKDARGRDVSTTFFLAKKGSQLVSLAFESTGSGYGGPIGVMIAIAPEDDVVQGIAVTTQSETPGLGTKIIDDPSFSAQFADKPLSANFSLSAAGGQIQAITGATVSSTGVSNAVNRGIELYQAVKPELDL